jgi:hypothetical protein
MPAVIREWIFADRMLWNVLFSTPRVQKGFGQVRYGDRTGPSGFPMRHRAGPE